MSNYSKSLIIAKAVGFVIAFIIFLIWCFVIDLNPKEATVTTYLNAIGMLLTPCIGGFIAYYLAGHYSYNYLKKSNPYG